MRAVSPALIAYLAALRAQPDVQALIADCYTFTLRSGTVLTYTNADVPIALNGYTYAANSVLVDGLAYKCAMGLEVDEQQITLAARPTDTIGGVPFLIAVHHGVLDGCEIQRERAFLASWSAAPIGSVILFKGRVTKIDQVGRTSAEVTVASDLVLLDLDMPRNFYQPTCAHTLYDSGCGLIKSAYGAAGTVGAGSTPASIAWAGAAPVYAQGTLIFTSGLNIGASVGIKSATSTALALTYPMSALPAPGDTFTAYQGCDHTSATCRAKFNNLANFRGFPFVPPPTSAY
jgi:uncharacterized phage protein (TIGR02218 family)